MKSKGSWLHSNRTKAIVVAVAVATILGITIGLAVGLPKKDKDAGFSKSKSKTYDCSSFSRQAVILISLDGYRPDYFDRSFSPNIKKLAENGVRAKYMKAQFPTKTFPNHYSIVTGLYPESHGIISNSFRSENRSELFRIGSKTSFEEKWWKGEPIWNTVRKQGLKSASYFWVGSEIDVNGLKPNYWYPYNGAVPFADRVDQVLTWLDMEPAKRPSFITLYFNEPDSAGHRYGPDSSQVNKAIQKVDDMIGRLVSGIEQRKLGSCVNIIIVSDHGMAKIACPRSIFLDQMISLENISVVGQGASSLLYLKSPVDTTKLIKELKCKNKHMRVFRRGDLDTPKRVHYSNNKRIGDIVLVPDMGWSVLRKKSACNTKYNGAHGYDSIYKEMNAFFAAKGPAFKSGLVTEPFSNIEVYNLVAEILQVQPAPNNGTFGSLSHLLKNSQSKIKPASNSDGNNFSTKCEFTCQPNAPKNNCSDFACQKCNETSQSMAAYFAHLNLTNQQRKHSLERNLPWGVPEGGAGRHGCLLVQNSFVTAYSSSLHIPLFVGYKLTPSQLNGSAISPCFRQDPRLNISDRTVCASYLVANYTPQQLAPTSDFLSDNLAQKDAHLLSNSLPQNVFFSGRMGLWKKVEDITRKMASKYGPLQIMSGSIFDSNGDGFRDRDDDAVRWAGSNANSPAIATHFYKIITRCNTTATTDDGIKGCKGKLESLAFVFPHSDEPTCQIHDWRLTLLQFTASINDVEKLIGSNLFPDLPPEFSARFKSQLPSSIWTF